MAVIARDIAMTTKSASQPFSIRRPQTEFLRRLRRFCAVVATAYDRWLQRQALAELDDRLLDDIGLTRGDVRRECAKGFWSRDA